MSVMPEETKMPTIGTPLRDSAVRIFGKPEIHGERRMGVALARGTDIKDAVAKACAVRDNIVFEAK